MSEPRKRVYWCPKCDKQARATGSRLDHIIAAHLPLLDEYMPELPSACCGVPVEIRETEKEEARPCLPP